MKLRRMIITEAEEEKKEPEVKEEDNLQDEDTVPTEETETTEVEITPEAEPLEIPEIEPEVPEQMEPVQTTPDVDAEFAVKATKEQLQGILNQFWDLSSRLDELKVYASQLNNENVEQGLKIANQVQDDIVISIGMIYKAAEYLSTDSNLIELGKQKAETLITTEEEK